MLGLKKIQKTAGVLFQYFYCCRHLIIAFGGLGGLESCLESDESIKDDNPASLFDLYINSCPDQGSRTIRTEVDWINSAFCLFFDRKIFYRKPF